MDWEAHRQGMLNHCLWMMSLDPVFAKSAIDRYSRLPHLQGLAEEVEAEWRRRFVGPARPLSSQQHR